MTEIESQVQRHLVTFCKFLPGHVGNWQSALQDSVTPLQNLQNLIEQRRHVQNANVKDFEENKLVLLNQISVRMEEDLCLLKSVIYRLSKSNNELKMKLLNLERCSVGLDWEKNSELIKGSGSQPALRNLLQTSLDFLIFFQKAGGGISDAFKNINLDDEDSVRSLEKSLVVKLDDVVVTRLTALTQYVDNTKNIL